MADRDLAACAEAYVRARYVVRLTDGEAHLPLGRPAPELRAVMARRGVQTAAFLTAWNPRSEPAGDAENRAAQARLEAELGGLGLDWLEAEGRDPDGGWPAEPSLIVLGIDFQAACDLAGAYGQNAILFCGPDAAMRLVFCRLGQAPAAN
jgi:hypothetical protein